MIKIKTSELIGLNLEYAVIKARFPRAFEDKPSILNIVKNYNYSTNWNQGGPIIEREGIELLCNLTAQEARGFIQGSHADWRAALRPIHRNVRSFGTTPLIAAMRCYVASKLGDEVDIPNELVESN